MNQGKLEAVKQEMARVNINVLGISELKWTGMGKFSSDNHYIYYCGQESLRRNGAALIVNKIVWNAVLGCNLKNDRMISVCFQGKPFNIMVIQVYDPATYATEKLYKKGLNDLDSHDGVVTHLEPDILECEVKWALGSITMNQLVEVIEFQLSYLKS